MWISKVWTLYGYTFRKVKTATSVKVNQALEVPRKVYMRSGISIRTANRHRWEGREDHGAREKHGSGTRQNSDRNFGIRSAPFGGPQLKISGDCLPKTQVPAKP